MKKVVIIGGGFAGINLAKDLSNKKNFHITIVDRNNYNFFPPLLYQVATGYLEASSISYPFRKMIRDKGNVFFMMGEFLKLIPAENKVELSTGILNYDILVFATGAETNYFGMENVKQFACPMKTINDALLLRNHFLLNLEKATRTTDEKETQKLLTIVVAGGGPTGVEISGMVAEMKKTTIVKDYPEFKGLSKTAPVYLVDGGEHLLSPMSKKSQDETYAALVKMGVEVKLTCRVKDYKDDVVTLNNGETIETKSLVWAAGVTASVLPGVPEESYGRSKRLQCDAFNKVQGLNNVYALGDTCIQTHDEKFVAGHPQVAQVAIQQGKNLAANFIRIDENKPLKEFKYHDKGSLAIIGRNKAVADLPSIHLHGFIAWFIWVFVHLMSLLNYRNRLRTLYNWVGAYVTKDQSLRLIIRPDKIQDDTQKIPTA